VLTGYTQAGDEAGAERFFRACFTALLALLGALTAAAWLLCEAAPR